METMRQMGNAALSLIAVLTKDSVVPFRTDT